MENNEVKVNPDIKEDKSSIIDQKDLQNFELHENKDVKEINNNKEKEQDKDNEEDAEKEVDEAKFSNVSSAIMLNLPTYRLPELRVKFESVSPGLNLFQYLAAVVSCMILRHEKDLIPTVADLIDFFMLVDINGDGFMEWDEFTTFIIEQVVGARDFAVNEKLNELSTEFIQDTSTRYIVKSATFIKEFGKLFIGVGPAIHIYSPDSHCASWTHLLFKFPLTSRDKHSKSSAETEPIDIIDMEYMPSKDVLVVVRGDLSFEFVKFHSRTSFTEELVENVGIIPFERPLKRIQIHDIPKDVSKIFAIGATKVVDSWKIQPGTGGKYEMLEHQTIEDHNDYVRDILVIDNSYYSILVTGAMDKKIFIYDLHTLRNLGMRQGHTAGVQCLAYDGRNILLGGGFDYEIIGWDLDQKLDRPFFRLSGHMAPVTKMIVYGQLERAVSLDASGILKIWDTTKQNPIDGEERQIDAVNNLGDKLRSFGVFEHLGTEFDTSHHLMLAAFGKKMHTYRIVDTTKGVSAPLCALFSYNLMNIMTIHLNDVQFWNASLGSLDNRVSMEENKEVSCAILDDRTRKVIVGDTKGGLTVLNCLNGSLMKSMKVSDYPVRHMIYSPDKIIVMVCGEGELMAVDEFPRESGINVNLRQTRAHDCDIVSIAYSHKLGLIASIDITGKLMIFDYEFWIVQYILNNCSGGLSDACYVKFLDPYPLLLIADSRGGFTIIPVGKDFRDGKHRIWRIESAQRVTTSRAEALETDLASDEYDLEEEEEEMASAASSQKTSKKCKAFTFMQVRRYRQNPHEVKCLAVLMEELSHEDDDSTIAGVSIDSEKINPNPDGQFPKNLIVNIICGHDDGTIAVYDLTQALRDINVGPIVEKDYIFKNPGYHPRRRVRKQVRAAEVEAAEIEVDQVERLELFTSCLINNVWLAHLYAINNLQIIGDFKNILTAGDDNAVYLWNLEAYQLGTLTRGKDLDRISKPSWRNPVDMVSREHKRKNDATDLVSKLKLKPVGYGSKAARKDAEDQKKRDKELEEFKRKAEEEKLRKSQRVKRLPTIIRQDETEVMVEERNRIVDQMHGKVTYIQSAKEIAQGLLTEQHAKSLQAIRDIGVDKKKKRKPPDFQKEPNEDDKYLESVNMPTEHVYTGDSVYIPKKEKGSEYGAELAQLEADDPHNWSITSTNRQRQLYANMFHEMDKAGLSSVDMDTIIESKLDTFSPGGSFKKYFKVIMEEKRNLEEFKAMEKMEDVRRVEEMEKMATFDRIDHSDSNLLVTDVPKLPVVSSPTKSSVNQRIFDPHPRHIRDVSADRSLDLPWSNQLRYSFYKAVPKSKNTDSNNSNSVTNTATAVGDDSTLKGVSETNMSKEMSQDYTLDLLDRASSFSISSSKVDKLLVSPIKNRAASTTSLLDALKDEKEKSIDSLSKSLGQNLSAPNLLTLPEPKQKIVEIKQAITSSKKGNRSWELEKLLVKEYRREKKKVLKEFESRVTITEEIYRKASKSNRKASRKARKDRKTKEPPPFVDFDTDNVSVISAASMAESMEYKQPVRRHTALSMLAKSQSLEHMPGVLTVDSLDNNNTQMTNKIAAAEKSWIDKVRYALNPKNPICALNPLSMDERGPVYTLAEEVADKQRESASRRVSRNKKKYHHNYQLEFESLQRKHDNMVNKIKNKTQFSQYTKKELLRFWKAWVKMEKTVKDDDDASQSSLGIDHYKDDSSAPPEHEGLDNLLQAIKLENRALHKLGNVEAVSLPELLKDKFTKLNSPFRKQLEVLVDELHEQNIPVQTVKVTTNEALSYLCPFLSADERLEVIRMYSFQPKPKVIEEHQQINKIDENDVRRMRVMFDYMDTDRSGYVDKDEIVAALMNDTDAIQEEIDKKDEEAFLMGSDVQSKEAPTFVWTEEKIIEMVSAVDSDGNLELDFEEFVGLFIDLL